jgi:hypothetical protein
MSARYGTNALALAILIALSAPGATQETGAPVDLANIPAAAGAFTHQEAEMRLKRSSSRVAPSSIGELSHNPPGLTENSWDFTSPDSIPGFGTLPQNYDPRPVLPRFSGE